MALDESLVDKQMLGVKLTQLPEKIIGYNFDTALSDIKYNDKICFH